MTQPEAMEYLSKICWMQPANEMTGVLAPAYSLRQKIFLPFSIDFYIEVRYILLVDIIAPRYIVLKYIGGIVMDTHTRKVYVPMTETGFYILFCLQKPNHGYGIVQMVEKLTDGEIRLSPGTMYGSLSKMEKDGLIRFINEEEKRKIYKITELGTEVLQLELKRIKRLYQTSQEVI